MLAIVSQWSLQDNVHSAQLFIFISVTPALIVRLQECWPGVRPGLYQAHVSLYHCSYLCISLDVLWPCSDTGRVEPGVGPDPDAAASQPKPLLCEHRLAVIHISCISHLSHAYRVNLVIYLDWKFIKSNWSTDFSYAKFNILRMPSPQAQSQTRTNPHWQC